MVGQKKLSALKFDSPSDAFSDFTRFHKEYAPKKLLHGGKPYDMVTGPMVDEITPQKVATIFEGRVQTSIHTPRAARIFNTHRIR
jgi:hypothetical protein